jgi:hypothetical protein
VHAGAELEEEELVDVDVDVDVPLCVGSPSSGGPPVGMGKGLTHGPVQPGGRKG